MASKLVLFWLGFNRNFDGTTDYANPSYDLCMDNVDQVGKTGICLIVEMASTCLTNGRRFKANLLLQYCGADPA